MDGVLYGLFTIGGPILLAAVLIYVIMSNRRHRSPEELARTEAATRELHRQLDAEDKYLDGDGPPPRKK
ncbi:hypothetical protein FIM10_06070 [Sphingomonadales bacterium 56]|jgi:hypothetical protein|uniref:Uncharacterized protein n=1 Tax=Sphingobium agri TaxID=2933566 RepID=A0ABT0DV56_9SPHN|nr:MULTISPECIES: hypothetical protein [Sphingomonadaceae]MBY2928239.1 hypothetical protein [Sphingomonadales bacterium 56]MBY2958339.1 hypothetical protein [Sphingomonadales bacterium 58]MCK0530995.1 hypothetical protein [Sphingobium agri]CAD7336852.1 hypothetical protein SPHS6_01226 [Sphingobium sp. S6]CAD7336911.1 hypothetical protein SPHS8_01264 [Sphingobium sp. S8]